MKTAAGMSVVLLVLVNVACNSERAAAPPPASASAATSHAADACGEYAMTRAGLIAEGEGEKHPKVVGVDAVLAQCEDKTPSPDACRRVTNELMEITAAGYGPNHPRVRSLRAQQSLCPK
jgi:hypothetical protein